MLDIGTVPKGKSIPFLDQLPALAVFDSKEQYYVAMAIGNQQEKEYHDRIHGRLNEFDVKARFIPDRRTLHPTNKAPQVYFMLINASSVGPEIDYLLPRIGDSADIVLKGISIMPQTVTEDLGDIGNANIFLHIKDSMQEVLDDNSPESESAADDKLYSLLQILCVRDETGNDISANLDKLQRRQPMRPRRASLRNLGKLPNWRWIELWMVEENGLLKIEFGRE